MNKALLLTDTVKRHLTYNAFIIETIARNEEEGLKRLTAWMFDRRGAFTYREVEGIVRQSYCEWKLEELINAS